MDTAPDSSQMEIFSSWALFIMIMLLIAALFTSYMLQQKKVEKVVIVNKEVANVYIKKEYLDEEKFRDVFTTQNLQ